MANQLADPELVRACRKRAMLTGRTFAEPLTVEQARAFLQSTRRRVPRLHSKRRKHSGRSAGRGARP